MQKARPYGGCLLALLTQRRLRNEAQGHSLTSASVHHKETEVYSICTQSAMPANCII